MSTGQLLPSRWRSDSIALRFAFGERTAECKGEKGISYQPKVATPPASDYGQVTKIHLKRRELEPAKPADGCESKRRQAQNGTCPHSATQSTRAWFSPDTYEGHGVEYRPVVTQNGYTERSNPQRLSPEGTSRRPGRMPLRRRIPQEANASGNAEDMLTWGRYTRRHGGKMGSSLMAGVAIRTEDRTQV